MSTWTVLVGFIGAALAFMAFFSRMDSFLIAGSILIAGTTIAAAIERARAQ